MDLFDIKLRLGVSRSHSASQSRSQPTILSAISGQKLSVIFSFLPLITGKIVSFTVKRTFSRLHSMRKMACQKTVEMPEMHVILTIPPAFSGSKIFPEIIKRFPISFLRHISGTKHEDSYERVPSEVMTNRDIPFPRGLFCHIECHIVPFHMASRKPY